MSICFDVTEQDLINLRKLAEHQKNQRALQIKKKILKQTHDIKLAECLSPITKKLEEVNQSTKKIGKVKQESKSENEHNQEIVPLENDSDNSEGDSTKLDIRAVPNSYISSDFLGRLRRLLSSPNSLKIGRSSSGATILGVPIYTLGGDKLRIRDTDCGSTPE